MELRRADGSARPASTRSGCTANRFRSHERYGNSSTPANWLAAYSAERTRVREVVGGSGEVQPRAPPLPRRAPHRSGSPPGGRSRARAPRPGWRRGPASEAPYASGSPDEPPSDAPYAHGVRAVVFDMVDPESRPSLTEVPEPEASRTVVGARPGHDRRHLRQRPASVRAQHRTVTHLGLHRDVPFVLGHETAGRVVEAGPNCSVAVGTRGGHRPLYPVPAPGDRTAVRQLRPRLDILVASISTVASSARGRSLGFTQDLGGGWADAVVAHDSMLHPMPDSIPTAAPASTSPSPSPATACCAPCRSTVNPC